MDISKEQIIKTAALAKLMLQKDELDRLGQELQDILKYAEVLGDLPSGGVDLQHSSPSVLTNPPLASLSRDQVLALAPESAQGMIRVPKVVNHAE